jgi:hypothetical protein
MMQFRKGLIVTAMLVTLLALSAGVAAQFAPFAPCGPLVQTGGYTRTVSGSSVAGTFIPPQTQVSDVFYSYPGINAFGPYPGCGYASTQGIGFTPYGYAPFGGFTYL